MVDLVGIVGNMAGVIMVGKQGGKRGQDRRGGGGRLLLLKALQIQDKYLLAQKGLLISHQETAFVSFQMSLFA